jgi:hypothetical protein
MVEAISGHVYLEREELDEEIKRLQGKAEQFFAVAGKE